jgi:hypothetical protein
MSDIFLERLSKQLVRAQITLQAPAKSWLFGHFSWFDP